MAVMLTPAEHALWCCHLKIGDRGVYTDGLLIKQAIAVASVAMQAVQTELQEITGGEITSTHQVDRILAWLRQRDCEVKNLQKGTLAAALRRANLDPIIRRVLELRSEAAHPALAKYQALQRHRCLDGRVRGGLRFHGAATGRWSAHGVQFHNFKRETENTAAKVAAVLTGDIEEVRKLGAPLEIVSEIIRAVIAAAPGNRLLVADFSGVESRVLAWLADELEKLAQWETYDRTGAPADDPYFRLGQSFGLPDESARKLGKVIDLAFGFQGGADAARTRFAEVDDTITLVQIEEFKQGWRTRHPNVFRFWKGIERAALAAVRTLPEPIRYGRLTLRCELRGAEKFLFIELPSGRPLAYPFITLIRNKFGEPAVQFQTNAELYGGWSPCNHGTGAYGGLWTENIVQGVARDLLAAAIMRLEAAGYPVVLHVHDEVICEVPLNSAHSVEEFQYLVNLLPDWAAQ
jgi:DNA polymerase